jgi:hypothetical protein
LAQLLEEVVKTRYREGLLFLVGVAVLLFLV